MASKKRITEALGDAASTRSRAQKALRASLSNIFKPMSGGSESNVDEVIPSGLEVLDHHVLRTGGWPVKRVVEVFSDPGVGKTSLGFSALASAQRLGGVAILIETEDALQVARATVFGVDLDDVLLYEPASFEEVLDGMREGLSKIPDGVGPNLIVWDSIAMSTLQDVMDRGMASKTVGRKAALMSQHFPTIVKLCKQKRCALMLINQSRTKIGVVFGNPTTTPGGETHKFASSIRLQLWGGSKVKLGDQAVGVDSTVVAVKNKLAIPQGKAKIRLLYETGWDDRWTTINHAKDKKLLEARQKVTDATYQQAREALGFKGEPKVHGPVLDLESDAERLGEDDE
jgi:recombination protein RecA